jgi:ATP-binding cassette subfamily B (MDR/TAP) protein 1
MKRLRPKSRGTFKLIPRWFATVPNKPLLYVGLAAGVAHGVCTPLWSFYIAKMINLVGAGDTHGVAHQGGILVAVSAAQGAAEWLKYWALFRVAAQWTAQIRDEAFTKVLAQDKAWFDESENAPQRLLQNLIKDVDDMRHLIATVVAGAIVVIVMVNVSVIWSLAVGWKLTLVGIAIAPVYIGVVAFTDSTTGRAEEKNKGYREALAKTFYEVSISKYKVMG